MTLLERLGLEIPILAAPMAGVSTPALALAVAEAGALGALGLGASTLDAARSAILEVQKRSSRPVNANVFCHKTPVADPVREAAWRAATAPLFDQFGATPPSRLETIYASFRGNRAMLDMLLETKPGVVSFHFGLPDVGAIKALKASGAVLIASATSLLEAREIEAAGLDAVVAQGWSAGGHRGMFDENAPDDQLSTEALTRQLVRGQSLPVIAAGGLMTGTDIAAALSWGAVAAQLGTAFVACPEATSDDAYRSRLLQASEGETIMTRVISGRPARSLKTDFARWGQGVALESVPDYPRAYDLGKALNAAARAAGDTGYGAHWAGGGADRARTLPAAELVRLLQRELKAAQG